MHDPMAQVREKLEELKRNYARDLPGRLDQLEACWTRVQDHGWDQTTVEPLYRQAHKLAGSAATFGFPEVSAAAQALEVLLQAHLHAPEPTPEVLAWVTHHLAAMRRAAQ